MGIPALVKVAKAMPVSEYVSSYFRTLLAGNSSGELSGSKKWRAMYKPRSRRRRSVFEIESELNTHDLLSMSGPDDSEAALRQGSR